MTDFNEWYAQEFPDLLTSVDDFRAELQRAYKAGFASQSRTLRDEFAGQALVGLAAEEHLTVKAITTYSYVMADAMLEARKTTGEDNK
jgi:hypothetical protein